MDLVSILILAMSFVLALAICTKIISYMNRRDQKLPPGPKPWPIIGNLHQIGPDLPQSLHKLSQKYGHLIYLKFGSWPVVLASSPKMAKEFLKTQDQIFASRPSTTKYASDNYKGLLVAPYGLQWRNGRKLYSSHLFRSNRLESYEYNCLEEMQNLISRLHALSGKNVTLNEHLTHTTLSILGRIAMGKSYFTIKSDEIQQMLDEFLLLSGGVGDWKHYVDFLDLHGYGRRMDTLFKNFNRLYEHAIQVHRDTREVEKDNFVPKDLLDDLLLQLDQGDCSSFDEEKKLINSDGIKGFIQDLIVAGVHTTASTIEWAISELVKQPHIINKAREELDRVIGTDRWVKDKDFPQLPYLHAIIKETTRLHPVVPILAPHYAFEDCKVEGYDISMGTIVFINTWSIGRDPTSWDEADKFKPERFIGRDIEMKGHNFELLPFGSGRRMCPGYNLGLKMVRLILGNLLHGFNLKLPDNMRVEDLNMEEVYALVNIRKIPLVVVMEPRLPFHLYK